MNKKEYMTIEELDAMLQSMREMGQLDPRWWEM